MSKRKHGTQGQRRAQGERRGKARDVAPAAHKDGRRPKSFSKRHPAVAEALPDFLFALAIVLAVFLVYHRALNYFFAQDDFTSLWIAREGPTTFWRILASFVYFRGAEGLFGLNPASFHLVSLLLHAVNGILVFMTARALSVGRTTSVFCALAFAVHPSLYASVYTISSIGEILSCLFVLLAALYVLRAARPHSAGGVLFVSALFAASLLCKETAILFPLLVFLMYWARGLSLRKALAPFAGLAVVAAAYAYFFYTANVFGVRDAPAAGQPYVINVGPELVTSVQTYLKWTFNILEAWKAPAVNVLDEKAGPWLLVGGLLAVLFVLSKGVRRRRYVYCGAWFILTLLPVVPLISHPYHYYLYTPLAGFLPAIGVLISGRLRRTDYEPVVSGALAVLFLVNSAIVISRIEKATVMDSQRRQDPVFDRPLVAGNLIKDFEKVDLPEHSRVLLVSPLSAILEGRLREHPFLVMGGTYWDSNLRSAIAEGTAIRLFFPQVDTVAFAREPSPEFDGYLKLGYTWHGRLREAPPQ